MCIYARGALQPRRVVQHLSRSNYSFYVRRIDVVLVIVMLLLLHVPVRTISRNMTKRCDVTSVFNVFAICTSANTTL